MPVDFNTLGIVTSIIVASVASAMYVSNGFRSLERTFYKALDLHAREDGSKFETLGNRILSLEIKTGATNKHGR